MFGMDRYIKCILIGLVASCCIAGCSLHKSSKPVMITAEEVHDDATVQLARAAASISRSLAELARIEATANPPKTKHLTDPNVFALNGVATVDWSGPVGPLVKKLANASHYKLRIIGKVPSLPVIISLRATNQPIGDIIRDVDYQAGKRADLVVFPKTKVIELRYAQR